MAYADDIATLPLLPINPLDISINEGTPLAPPVAETDSRTPLEYSTIPSGHEIQYDDTYTLSGGNYETHSVLNVYGQYGPTFFEQDSEVVTASHGIAPPVGTEWDQSIVSLPIGGDSFSLYADTSMTTPDGTVDVLTPDSVLLPASLEYSNEYYNGPAGIFDDLVSSNGATVIPIIDLPADSAPGAAAEVSTLWSELLGTL